MMTDCIGMMADFGFTMTKPLHRLLLEYPMASDALGLFNTLILLFCFGRAMVVDCLIGGDVALAWAWVTIQFSRVLASVATALPRPCDTIHSLFDFPNMYHADGIFFFSGHIAFYSLYATWLIRQSYRISSHKRSLKATLGELGVEVEDEGFAKQKASPLRGSGSDESMSRYYVTKPSYPTNVSEPSTDHLLDRERDAEIYSASLFPQSPRNSVEVMALVYGKARDSSKATRLQSSQKSHKTGQRSETSDLEDLDSLNDLEGSISDADPNLRRAELQYNGITIDSQYGTANMSRSSFSTSVISSHSSGVSSGRPDSDADPDSEYSTLSNPQPLHLGISYPNKVFPDVSIRKYIISVTELFT